VINLRRLFADAGVNRPFCKVLLRPNHRPNAAAVPARVQASQSAPACGPIPPLRTHHEGFLVSAIITKLTGRLAEDYARQRLFDPLGINDWHWDRDPQFLTIGEGMLYLLPRDAAKLGYLYLRHGEWDGRQLLPDGWADVLNHKLVTMHASWDANLGYFFWVFPDRRVYMVGRATGRRSANRSGVSTRPSASALRS
jgi:hypothetical protein